jgi:DNA-binding MarR family transcriptional regulator
MPAEKSFAKSLTSVKSTSAVKSGKSVTATRPVVAQAALNEAWRVMHFALRAVIAEPDRILATRGLTRMHHRILFFVAHTPGMSVGELQSTLDVTKQALNAPLRQLQTQGLIELAKADHDARVREIRLTIDGLALEAKLTGEQEKLFADAFAKAGEKAYDGWRAVMLELARHAGMR